MLAGNVVDTANKAARTIKEEIDRALDALPADDPDECPASTENDDRSSDMGKDLNNKNILEDLKAHDEPEIPTIRVNPDDASQP